MIFCRLFIEFCADFDEIFSEWRQIPWRILRIRQISGFLTNSQRLRAEFWLFLTEFCQNSVRNHQDSARRLSEFVRNPEIWRILNILYGIWRNSEKCSSKSVQNSIKIMKNSKLFSEILKIAKTFRRKFAKILNLERCKGMIIL